MTKKGTKTKKPAQPKQLKVPGTERKTNGRIEDAAASYVEARDTRMEHTKSEKKAHDQLLATMKAEGIPHYIFEDAKGNELEVKVNAEEKVKVKRVKDDSAGDDE